MNSRSTHAVVGLCGNDVTITRGRGHACFVRGVQVREEVLLGAHAHVVHRGAGEDRAPDVDRVRRARHQRGVAGADEREHQVREALLRADRRAHLGLEVERRRRTCAGRGRRPPCAASGCPCSSSSDGCAGCAPPRRASRPRPSGDGMSGLPNARSMTSSPARRNSIFSASIWRERVRRQRVDPAELHDGRIPVPVSVAGAIWPAPPARGRASSR